MKRHGPRTLQAVYSDDMNLYSYRQDLLFTWWTRKRLKKVKMRKFWVQPYCKKKKSGEIDSFVGARELD